MSNIGFAIIGVLLFIVCLFVVNYGLQKSEVVDCLKWQKQASESPAFYLLKWQAEQCEAHDIRIDAVIK